MRTGIYLDNHATTPLDPRVLEAMLPFLTEHFGNPSSNHPFGWISREAVEKAREEVAALINAAPEEIVFTSGATESNNLALLGAARALQGRGRHIVSFVTEHKAVLDPLKVLASEGFEVTLLPVGRDGVPDPGLLAHSLRPDTVLVSVMAANNEIGVLAPLEEIGALCEERGILLHTDAAQALGKVPLDVRRAGVALASFSAHKLYGPPGVGALFVRRRPRVPLRALIHGGGHERGVRSGTLNTPGIVGFGAACRIAAEEMPREMERTRALRDRLLQAILARVPDAVLNGHLERRLPGNLNLSFPGVEGESLLMHMGDVAVSSSSACTSNLREPSHVLKALGLSDEMAFAALRFGIGRFNTEEDIRRAAERVGEAVSALRALGRAAARPD